MVSTNIPGAQAPAVPADTGRSRGMPRGGAFWLVGLVSVLLLVASTVPSPMYVIYQQRWHFSAAMITVVFGVYALFVLGSMLLFGSLSDTAGRRPVLVLSLLLMALAMVLFIVAGNVWVLLVARAVQGIGAGIATGTLGAALIELSPRSAPARGMLINTVAPTFGMALGALGSGLLVQYAPLPTKLSYIIELVLFVALGVALLFLPETAPSAGSGFRIVLRRISIPKEARRPFALVALSIVAVWSVGGLFLSLGPSLVAQMLHSNSHVLGGLVVTALAGGGTVAQLALGRLSGLRPIALGGLLLLAGLGLDTLALSQHSAGLFFTGTVVLGLGWGTAFMGAFRSMAALADPVHRGELLAAVYVVAYLAMSLPAIGAGIAVPHAGLHTTTNVFTAVVAALIVVALGSLPFVSRHHRSGRVGAHEPVVQHTPGPCCLATHDAAGSTAAPVPVGAH
ncbi:MFS transporter [Streptacidiphilus sp. N1-10]|uniref:MFS transporter n=1 Tax=Streptacidiphilus jeojiensis TaxID=3229225 RepID=A0ABV6XRU8_9ACTN